jgi:lambda family phage portal protein
MGPRRAVRMYHNARVTRATAGWSTGETSADAELEASLISLRNRSRALVRDAAYAKRAKVIVVNNVVGPGVGMQAQIRRNGGRLAKEINDPLEAAWRHWSRPENCHTGGKLHFADLERTAFGQIFEAGEVLIRKHYRRFGDSRVPMCLELIEAERVADRITKAPDSDNEVRMGVEVDQFQRPLAYWLRTGHPGDLHRSRAGTERLARVPADQMFHLYIVDRWPQSRGEPWLHATARRLNDMDGYSEAEIIAARNSATQMGFVETAIEAVSSVRSMVDETDETDGEQRTNFEPGVIEYLAPGQSFKEHNPSRPNTAIDPFLRYMLREVAAGIGGRPFRELGAP